MFITVFKHLSMVLAISYHDNELKKDLNQSLCLSYIDTFGARIPTPQYVLLQDPILARVYDYD